VDVASHYGTKVRRYNWHSAEGWPFPMLKYKYIFQAILSSSTRKLLLFEITKTLIAALKSQFIVPFIIILSTLSFPRVSGHALQTSVVYLPIRAHSLRKRDEHPASLAAAAVAAAVWDESCIGLRNRRQRVRR